MKKQRMILPILSAVLLAPAVLAHQVAADEQAATPTVSTEVVESATAAPVTEAVNTEAEAAPTAVAEMTSVAEKDVVILHTNDVHGRIVEDRGVIGDAKLAAVITNERAKADQTTLVVDAGDAFQGLPISNSSKGEERANILNKMEYDAMAVGNHEFDFGLDEAKKYKEILKFPLLSVNTYVNNARLFEASTIVDKDKTVEGDEIVVIGVTTPETATKTHPKNVAGVVFKDPIPEVNQVIAEIEARAKADGKTYQHYVILAHLGIDTTTPVEWRGSTLAEALANNALLKGKRVTVIDGHSHTVASTTYGENVVYSQTGSYLNNIGKVTYKANEILGTPEQISAASVKDLAPNAEIAELVKQIKEKYDAANAVVVLQNNPVELNGSRMNVRVRETNLGNVVADALYEYGQTGFSNRTHLAVTNGGGLRETIAKDKPVTKGDIIAVLPFGNTISQIKVTGQQLADMFAKAFSATLQEKDGQPVLDENGQPLMEPNGAFLHVSGAKVYYDTTLPAAERILNIQIKNIDTDVYEKLDLTKTYFLATNDFLAAGGDGYTMLGGAREEGPSMDTVFAEYLENVDLTQHAIVNPNSRLISISTADYQALQEKKNNESEQPKPKENELENNSQNKPDPSDKDKQPQNQNKVPLTVFQRFVKDNKQTLPKTNATDSTLLSLFGFALAALGFALFKKENKS